MTWLLYAAVAYLVYYLYVSSRKGKGKGQAKAKVKSKPKKGALGTGEVRPPPPAVQAVKGPRAPHEVLGVPPEASAEQIRRAYQKRMQEYHPDRVANAAEELRQLAEKRSKEINAAYQSMMQGVSE